MCSMETSASLSLSPVGAAGVQETVVPSSFFTDVVPTGLTEAGRGLLFATHIPLLRSYQGSFRSTDTFSKSR